jgi:aryl-alcohol dehydrogenase-like predicted oxidoreductase
MQYTQLGSTGLVVSRLCFGSMTFGSHAGSSPLYKVDQQNARAMVAAARDAGINFFDTADIYAKGESETMLGQLLAPHRQEVVIATKAGFRSGAAMTQAGLSRQHILSACDASLKRLGTDYIDLYQVHRDDPLTPLEETLAALDQLVRAGKVRYLGFSNWPAWKAAAALQLQQANGWARFASGQMHYSLLNRDVEHEVVPFMRHFGLNMMVWSPLAGGFLSGKYTRDNMGDKDNRHAAFDIVPFDHEAGFSLVEQMKTIAARHDASVAGVALAWLLAKSQVGAVIVGASKPHQLDSNLAAADLRLTPADLAELDRLTAPPTLYPHWYNAQTGDRMQTEALRR